MTVRPAVESASSAPLRGIARGGAANLVGAAVTAVAQFGLTIVLTRGLPKERVGVFFATTSVFLLAVVVGNLGANTGLVYFISRTRARRGSGQVSAYLRTAFRPVVALSVVMAIAMFLLAPQLADLVGSDRKEETATYLRALALFIPFASLESLAVAGSRGMGSMRSNVVVSMVGRPLLQLGLVAAVVVAAESNDDLIGVSWGLAYLPAGLVALVWMRRATRAARAQAHGEHVTVGRTFWSFSSARAVTSVLQIATQRLDVVLVAALAGAGPAAIYAAATRFVVVGQMSTNAISLATQPRLAQASATHDRTTINEIYRTSTAWLMALSWPLYLVLAIYGETLLGIFGPGYHVAGNVLVLISAAMLLSTAFGMVDTVLAMSGHTSWNLINATIGLVVQIGLDVLLIPRIGFVGAAWGWAASIVVRNVVALTLVAVSQKVHPFGRSTGLTLALNLVAFLAIPLTSRVVIGQGWPALVVGGAVGGAVYVLGLWLLRHELKLGSLGPSGRRRNEPETTPRSSAGRHGRHRRRT